MSHYLYIKKDVIYSVMKHLSNYLQFINESQSPQMVGDGVFSWLINPKKQIDKKIEKLVKLRDEAESKRDDKRVGELEDEIEKLYDKKVDIQTNKENEVFAKKLNLAKSEAIKYYKEWFNNKATQNKFKNKENLKKIKDLLNGVKVFLVPQTYVGLPKRLAQAVALVLIPRPQDTKGIDGNLKLKKCQLTEKETEELAQVLIDGLSSTFKWRNFENVYWVGGTSETITQKTINQTILHEIGHLIDYRLSSLGEAALSNYFDQSPQMEPSKTFELDDEGNPKMTEVPYSRRSVENAARLRVFRKFLELSPTETPISIINKLMDNLKKGDLYYFLPSVKKYITFEEGILEVGNDKKTLIIKNCNKYGFGDGEVLTPPSEGESVPRLRFGMNNEDMSDISDLLASYSRVENNTLIIDIEKITKINNEIAMNQKDSVASKTA